MCPEWSNYCPKCLVDGLAMGTRAKMRQQRCGWGLKAKNESLEQIQKWETFCTILSVHNHLWLPFAHFLSLETDQIQCILSRFNESAVWGLHATLLGLKGVVREPRAIAFVLWEPPCIPKLYLSSPHAPFYTHSAQGVRLCWNLSRFLARVITWEGSKPLRALIGFLLGQLSWPSGLNYATLSRLGLESFLILIALGILFSLRSIPITYEWQWGLRGKISFFSFSFHANTCFPLLPTRVEASYASPRGLVNKFHINTSSFKGGVGLINPALNTVSLIFKCVCALSVIHDPKWAFKIRLKYKTGTDWHGYTTGYPKLCKVG